MLRRQSVLSSRELMLREHLALNFVAVGTSAGDQQPFPPLTFLISAEIGIQLEEKPAS